MGMSHRLPLWYFPSPAKGIPLNELTADRILELATGRYSIPKPLPQIEDVMPRYSKAMLSNVPDPEEPEIVTPSEIRAMAQAVEIIAARKEQEILDALFWKPSRRIEP